ncbi:canalicular multispecific organic anion transporter 2-like [Galendromus occidentalis]|uniref:ABC-type glutathione-S-conjugate transporter n=1 Tax=Galendromus occidentalis TaxID=34638 RepID=A0AAJ6QY07_9ACAR|nr:canalicular multispecific organic anion transporter 2-like [Galendromus occidentalis]
MRFCRSPIWDHSFWRGDKAPVLTPCLENVLVTLPGVFMLFGGLLRLCYQGTGQNKNPPITILHLCKIITSVVLALLHLCSILLMTGSSDTVSDFACGSLRCLSFAMTVIVQTADRRKSIASSTFLVLFWVLCIVCEVPIYYRCLLIVFGYHEVEASPPSVPEFVVILSAYPLLLVQLVLAAFSEDLTSDGFGPRKRNPFYAASPISKVLYGFFTDLVMKGYRKALAVSDLPPPLDEMTSKHCYDRWKKTVKRYEAAGENVSLLKSMLRTYWRDIVKAWLVAWSFCSIRVLSFLALNELILFLSTSDQPTWKGCAYSLIIFFAYTSSSLMIRWADYFAVNLGLKLKAVLISAIVRKSHRISSAELGKYTVGEMVNLLSVDADKINQFSFYVAIMTGCPFYITLCTIMLWRFLGPACLVGISVIVVMMPLTGTVASWTRKVQAQQMNFKDSRLKYISEILSSIKIIKFYGWEPPFISRVRCVRYDENVLLKKMAYLIATLRFFWSTTPFLVSLFAFVAYLYVNGFVVIETNVAFVSLSLFNSMRFSLSIIPDVISNAVQTWVSLRRIEKFLNLKDLTKNLIGDQPGDGNSLRWAGATLQWSDSSDKPALENVHLEIKTGELVAIVGKVGAGKSSLLSSVLGDLHLKHGRVDRNGSLAYVPQQAWIQNATIKDNILFTRSFERQHYRQVVEKCCLAEDLKVLPGGERTEIGEKGVNLSGGQKQRISLARAVYQNKDVYLLDDPLSAVDAHVGSAIFRDVIGNCGMLRSKTRIFVTNMLSILPFVDRIVFLKDGRIVEQGTYIDLKNSTAEFADFLKEHASSSSQNQTRIDPESSPVSPNQRSMSISSIESTREANDALIMEEVMESGNVKFSVYRRYFSKVGSLLCLSIIIGFAGARTFDVMAGLWLSEWSRNDAKEENGTSSIDEEQYATRTKRILIYAALGFLYGAFSFLGTACLANGTVNAARKLHNAMLDSVIRAPMSFFDTTPLGRLLNRFGKDVDQLDIQLPVVANLFFEMFFQLMGVLVLIAYNVPVFLIFSSPLLVLYFIFQRLYMTTIRQIKRLESVTRSPVYNHFSESLNGLSSIRAYGARSEFVKKSDEKVDVTQNCSYLLFIGKMWLGTRLDIVSHFMVLVSNILIVTQQGIIHPGVAGYIVSYSIGTSFAFNFIVHYASEAEAAIVASERLEEYSELDPEAPWETDEKPPRDWPAAGEIEFQNYATRYRPGLELVLKKVNLRVAPGTKVGIVGRTGAGKSSMTLSLFRILEAAEGRLSIDGMDVSKLGLHDLRPRLTIIPQDPVIFSGTLRMNLDPNSNHTDDELWNALEKAHVKEQFRNNGLDTEIAEGGSNLSVGQRQLICLARAILQKKRILIMDEATAAVDVETDALIQNTIRADFSECTIIIIAHRLNTVIDCDRVIVMDKGAVVEEGEPTKLLLDPESRFHMMARDAGLRPSFILMLSLCKLENAKRCQCRRCRVRLGVLRPSNSAYPSTQLE